MKLKKMAFLILVAGGILYGICTHLAYAGGAYIYEVANPTDVGYASAGLAARAGDAGTVFTNPAGMTRFQESTYQAGLMPLYIHAPFDSNDNTTASGPDKGIYELLPIPTFAAILPVMDRLKLGVSVQNFFGLALEWDNDWVGRYEVTSAALMAPQLQPTVAYKVSNWLSIGAGAGLTLGVLRDEAKVNNLDPNLGDGRLKYDATDFAVQGNFGVMIEPSDKTRIGLRYLTETDLDFKARIYLSGVGPAIADATKDIGKVDLKMKMPQALMAGIFHQFNDQWAFLGSVGWDDWSQFERIHVKVDGTGINRVVHGKFDDVWHFGVAAQYQYTPKWMFSGGFSYDTDWQSGSNRPMELPLGAMYRYGAGVKYRKSDKLTLGAGLTVLWEGDLKVKQAGSDVSGGVVDGKYENAVITFLSLYAQW
jgi:long-chain fatty acid transport protein